MLPVTFLAHLYDKGFLLDYLFEVINVGAAVLKLENSYEETFTAQNYTFFARLCCMCPG